MTSPAFPADVSLETATGESVAIRGNCSLGRSSENTVVVRETRASRRHAVIHAQGDGEYWLVDLGSSNGTLLNGRRVAHPVQLKDGDRVTIVETTLVFRQKAPTAAEGEEGDFGTVSFATIVDIRQEPCWLLIADVEEFTVISQRLPADELSAVIGRWVRACKEHIETHGGAINKFLGDGFIAYWRGGANAAGQVAAALGGLKAVHAAAEVVFRVVVHQGPVTFGGSMALGEESLGGPQVNLAFRMEKVAAGLGLPFCLSVPAGELLAAHLEGIRPVPGEHELKGFPGRYRVMAWS